MKGTIDLIKEVVTVDNLRMETVTETTRTVFAEIDSISQSEFFAAADADLKPEYRFTVFFADYEGEKLCEFEGDRFAIYRTLRNSDRVELYAERRAGHDE